MSGLDEIPNDVISGLEEMSTESGSGPEELPEDVFEERQRPVIESSKIKMVAAMDFGTTYSGYAFKLIGLEGHENIYVKSWNEEYGSGCLPSEKAPTCVLLNANGDFRSFGYTAEREYSECEDPQNWRFFKHFKMILHRDEVSTLFR